VLRKYCTPTYSTHVSDQVIRENPANRGTETSAVSEYRWLRHRLKNHNEQTVIIILILIMIAPRTFHSYSYL
jgi:hypothetical protein